MNTNWIKLLAVTVLLAVPSLGSLQAQGNVETTKGPRPSQMMRIHTQAELDAVGPTDTIAMVCGMCKSVTIMTNTAGQDSKERSNWMRAGSDMDCPGCGGKITINGGSGKETKMTHTCSKCGGESAFCCATKNGQKTQGM